MYRHLIVLMAAALLATPAWPQEAEEQPAASEDSEVPTQEEAEPEFDETGLDEQGFEDQDDDFRPSEEIPTDQSIEFPTDI